MRKLKSKDLLLLLLYVPGPSGQVCEPVRGRTLLQKMVFLFEKEVYPKLKEQIPMSEEDLPRFEAFRFGPFSKSVMEDIEFLTTLGLVKVTLNEEYSEPEETEYEAWKEDFECNEQPEASITETFWISEIGVAFVKDRILPTLSDPQIQAVQMLKTNCLQAGLRSVLRYVYTRYPQMAQNSEIKSQVLGHE